MNPILIRAILSVIAALLGGGGLFQAGQASSLFSASEFGGREIFAVSWPFAGAGLAAILAVLSGKLDGTPKEVAEAARDWVAHAKEKSPESLRRAILSTVDVIVAATGDRFPKVSVALQALVNAVIEELGPTIVKRLER